MESGRMLFEIDMDLFFYSIFMRKPGIQLLIYSYENYKNNC